MKKFLAIYLGSENSPLHDKWQALSETQRQERQADGMTGWMKWAESHQAAIKDPGGPLGKTLLVDSDGVLETSNNITAYTIVEAESHEAAAKFFIKHPHFMIFPGDSVEVMECLPIPTP